MSYPRKLERLLRQEKFDPSWLGILVNPFYIIRKRLIRTISASSNKFRGDILDFGCGEKPYRSLFSVARCYIGVDVAIGGHSHHNSQIDCFYDGITLPFLESTFDHVVAFEVFEHIFNLESIILEISRVLRPSGDLLFSVPFAWNEHEQPYDFGRYTTFGITTLIERNGFIVCNIFKTNSDVEAIAQLFAAYLYESVGPRNRFLKSIFQLPCIAPVTVVGLLLGRILPNSGQLYSNLVVEARKAAR